jgi:hypothetical protein
MQTHQPRPIDCNGVTVHVGSRVRVLSLSGEWYEKLPADERALVDSMIGEVFEVEEIDEYGQPWVCKRWPDEAAGTCQSHSIALEPQEMLSLDASNDEAASTDQAAIEFAKAQRTFEELVANLEKNRNGPRGG